jgi:hypothetical protein
VAEELTRRDLVTVGQQAGEPSTDRSVEVQPVLGFQLQHDRGQVGLGDASDADPVLRRHRLMSRHICLPTGEHGRAGALADEVGDAGDARSDGLVQRLLHRHEIHPARRDRRDQTGTSVR